MVPLRILSEVLGAQRLSCVMWNRGSDLFHMSGFVARELVGLQETLGGRQLMWLSVNQ